MNLDKTLIRLFIILKSQSMKKQTLLHCLI